MRYFSLNMSLKLSKHAIFSPFFFQSHLGHMYVNPFTRIPLKMWIFLFVQFVIEQIKRIIIFERVSVFAFDESTLIDISFL